MANKSKPKFELKQKIDVPGGICQGTIIERTEKAFSETVYHVVHETSPIGTHPPRWYTEAQLVEANRPLPFEFGKVAMELNAPASPPALNPKARAQLRARRKSKR